MKAHEFLVMHAKVLATYDRAATKICQKYKINHTCFDILVFLKNNPQYDTARSIEQKRGIKKSMASVAIETLYQMEYIRRRLDESDRRIQHLELTEKSKEITDIGLDLQSKFQEGLLALLTPEEQNSYLALSEKVLLALHDMEEKLL